MDSLANNPLTRIPKSCSSQVLQRPRPWLRKTFHFSHSKHNDVPKCVFLRIRVRAGLEELIHNQVLISATVAGLGSQLLKPFVPAVLGRGFNWELALTSGGMPSSHSSSVVAAATAIGLERGFADSLFGLSVVIAGLIMYDAQVSMVCYPPLLERLIKWWIERIFFQRMLKLITGKDVWRIWISKRRKTRRPFSSSPSMMDRREMFPPEAVSMQKNRYKQRCLGNSDLQNMENRETINQNTLNYSFKPP